MLHGKANSFLLQLIVFLLLCFAHTPSFTQDQNFPFKQFPLPRELPNIERMFEDHFGFIWLGTAEGLYRFDGINYTLHTSKDAHSGLGREAITYMFEDNEQNFWVGTKKGLCRYDREKRDFELFSFQDDMYPRYVHQESDSSFLVHCLQDIYLFYPATKRWQKVNTGIKGNEVYAVQRGNLNTLWIGTDGKVRKYDLQTKDVHDYALPVPPFANPGEKISASTMFFDSHDQLWINTWHKGVMKLDTRTGQFETFYTSTFSKKNYLLEMFNPTITEDDKGNIWLASPNQGINIYHHDTGKISHMVKGTDYTNGLIGSVFVLMAGKQKDIWVKSNLALHYLARNSPVPKLISVPGSTIEDALTIRFLLPDYALVGTYFGLYGISMDDGKVVQLNGVLQLPDVNNAEFQMIVDIILNKDKTFWVTSPQGLRLVQWELNERGDPVFQFKKLLPTAPPFMPARIFPVHDSLILVKGRSNTNTLAIINIQTGAVRYQTLPDSLLINQITPYKNDTIILTIRNRGLYYYHLFNETLDFVPWKSEGGALNVHKPVFLDIQPLADGSFGCCTEENGVLLFTPGSGIFEQIDLTSVANSNRAFSITEDASHHLWIQTLDHLLKYEPENKNLSKVNLSNAFPGYKPEYFLREGREIFCTYEGSMYQVNIDERIFKSVPPKLYLHSVRARDAELNWWHTDQIKLAYANNFLSFDFTGLDYDNPQGISYWYKVPEISNDWQFLGSRTSVSFGHLTPGKYHFIIKASNDAGIWSEEIHAPEIIIRQPFWRSWWFILGISIMVASVIIYFIKLSRAKQVAEIRLRNQIARDLHDDIGSTLSGIKIFSGIASGMSGSNKELTGLLQQIRDKSDLMMQSMSDIVWSINPVHDSLHDMMIRLKQYMSEVLESQDIDVHYSAPPDMKSLKIDLEHRKELYLALKEIINNAAKYAACHHFYFEIAKRKGEIMIRIRDDGKGMDPDMISEGNGLKNIESRLSQIGAKLVRESAPGKGVSYEITMHIL